MMHAHRRGVLLAALWVYAYRGAASFVVAYPVARAVGSFGPTTHPAGDRTLFLPGGLRLGEAFRLGARAIGAALEASAVVGSILSVAGLLALGGALATLIVPEQRMSLVVKRAAELFPAFVALAVAALVLQGLVVGAAVATSTVLSHITQNIDNERTRDLIGLTPVPVAAATILGVGLVEDLARASSAAGGLGARAAIGNGLRAFARAPKTVLGAYCLRAAAAIALVAGAALATRGLDVSRPGTSRVVGVFAVHHAALFGVSVLRVSWLRRALACVSGGA